MSMTTGNAFPMRRTGLGPKMDVVALGACALVGIAMSPILGNAAALVINVPRRLMQVVALLTSAGFAVHAARHLLSPAALRHSLPLRRFGYALLGSAAFVAVRVGAALMAGERPSLYAIFVALATPVWMALLLTNLIEQQHPKPAANPVHASLNFNVFVAGLSLGIALTAYFLGPDPGEIHMGFRGSTTHVGTSAATLVAIALAVLKGWSRVASVLLGGYLNFLATSRTGFLVLIFMVVIVVLARAREHSRAIQGTTSALRDTGLIVICAVLLVYPTRYSTYYPYVSSRPGPSGARVEFLNRKLTDSDALQQRYKRVVRLFRGPVAPDDLTFTEIQRLEAEGLADSRWTIISQTLRTIAADPWGYWPKPFEQATTIYCGRPPVCRYPHNLALEIGYHFGWVPFAIAAVGSVVLFFRTVMAVTHPALLVRISAITLLAYLAFAQVSGNLLDQSLTLGFFVAWMIMRAAYP